MQMYIWGVCIYVVVGCVRHAGVVWGGVGGVLFFVAACWGVLPVWGCVLVCVVVV